jgi:hypothetical protein
MEGTMGPRLGLTTVCKCVMYILYSYECYFGIFVEF